ncbi:MAG: hypothetical protein LW823_02270 [Rickettsiales bacterium]|jgi:hypothetical protein|nr:hypothetical protein [Rickettsiales bacterium]
MAYDSEEGDYSGRGRFDQTSDFSTTVISNDGRFLGVKLSQEMASQLRTFYPALLDWARRQGEKITAPTATKFAKSVLGATEHEATKFAGKTTNAVGYGIILSNQLFDVGGNVYDSVNSLNDLRQAVKPLHGAGAGSQVSPLSGDNEVVSNARSKIKNLFWSRLLQTATGTIAIAPALMSKIGEQKIKNREREEKLEFERIKNDPDALSEFISKGAGDKATQIESEVSAKALEIAIEKRRVEYINKYEAYKGTNSARVTEEIKKGLEVTPDNVRRKLTKLREYGIDTRYAEQVIYQAKADKSKLEQALKQASEELNRTIAEELPDIVEQRVKASFVKQNGAFDREWEEHGGYDRNRKPTIKDEIESKYRKLEESSREHDEDGHRGYGGHKHNEPTGEIAKMAAGLGAGIVSELFSNKLVGKKLEKYSDPIALDRILHLRRVLEKAKGDAPEAVPDFKGGSEMGYVRYVHEIFQEHQRDCGRTEIGARFSEQMDKARWDDAAIFQLKDEELNPYEFAVRAIAKRIKDGRMDAIALVELVGNKGQKIVRDDGRSFGPLGIGKDDAAVKEALKKIIDDKSARLRVEQNQTQAQFNEKLGDFTFNIDDLKRALDDKTQDPELQAFLFEVFSQVVGSDDLLSKKLGMSKERILKLRKDSDAVFSESLDGVVKVLAEMLEKEPDKLKQLIKITDKEQELIANYAVQLNEGKHVSDITPNREERKAVETIVANALMTMNKPEATPGFWSKVVAARKSIIEPKKNNDVVQSLVADKEEAASMADRVTKRRSRGQEPSEELMGV